MRKQYPKLEIEFLKELTMKYGLTYEIRINTLVDPGMQLFFRINKVYPFVITINLKYKFLRFQECLGYTVLGIYNGLFKLNGVLKEDAERYMRRELQNKYKQLLRDKNTKKLLIDAKNRFKLKHPNIWKITKQKELK